MKSAIKSKVIFANNNLFVILNCDETSAEDMLSKPIPPDENQMAVGQSLLDFTNLIKIEITQFLDFLLRRYFYFDDIKDIANMRNNMGLMKEHISLLDDKDVAGCPLKNSTVVSLVDAFETTALARRRLPQNGGQIVECFQLGHVGAATAARTNHVYTPLRCEPVPGRVRARAAA